MDRKLDSSTSPRRGRRWLLWGTAALLLGLLLLPSPHEDNTPNTTSTPATATPASPPSDAAGPVQRSVETSASGSPATEVQRDAVRIQDENFTVNANGQTLKSLLDDIARQSAISINLAPELEGHVLQMTVNERSLERGLRTLLAEFDLFYSYMAGQPMRLASVWVYPKGAGANLQPLPFAEWASVREAEQQLDSNDAAQRAQAIEILIERRGAEALKHIMEGLEDPDDAVRVRSLDMALSRGVRLDAGVLQRLLQADPSAQVRLLALTGLAEDAQIGTTELRTLAQLAADDDNEFVKTQAQNILERLEPVAALPSDHAQGDPLQP